MRCLLVPLALAVGAAAYRGPCFYSMTTDRSPGKHTDYDLTTDAINSIFRQDYRDVANTADVVIKIKASCKISDALNYHLYQVSENTRITVASTLSSPVYTELTKREKWIMPPGGETRYIRTDIEISNWIPGESTINTVLFCKHSSSRVNVLADKGRVYHELGFDKFVTEYSPPCRILDTGLKFINPTKPVKSYPPFSIDNEYLQELDKHGLAFDMRCADYDMTDDTINPTHPTVESNSDSPSNCHCVHETETPGMAHDLSSMDSDTKHQMDTTHPTVNSTSDIPSKYDCVYEIEEPSSDYVVRTKGDVCLAESQQDLESWKIVFLADANDSDGSPVTAVEIASEASKKRVYSAFGKKTLLDVSWVKNKKRYWLTVMDTLSYIMCD